MEFSKSFIPAHIKYNFASRKGVTFLRKDWTACWLNVKPSSKCDYKVQINCYPKQRDEDALFIVELDYRQIEHGKLQSRTMPLAAAMIWSKNQKENRIFYAIDEAFLFRKFNRYLFNLSLIMELYDGIDNAHERSFITKETIVFDEGNVLDTDDERTPSKAPPKDDQSPVYAQVIPKHKRPNYGAPRLIVQPDEERIEIVCSAEPSADTSKADESLEAPMEIMRVEDDAGDYAEVELRPRTEKKDRLARPLAVVSNLFKSRFSSDSSKETAAADKRKSKDTNRASWNIFRSKPKKADNIPSFLHFDEPANTERFSLSTGKSLNRYSDWFDLNTNEMKFFEAHITGTTERRRSDYARRHSDGAALHKQAAAKNHLTISREIPWSHNLQSARNSMTDASQINLMGANVNRKQANSDVFVEGNHASNTGSDEGLASTSSEQSDGADHYIAMKPILDNLAHQTKLVNQITKTINGLSRMSTPARRSSGFASASTTDSSASSSSELDRHPCPIETKVVVVANREFVARDHAFKVPQTAKVLKTARQLKSSKPTQLTRGSRLASTAKPTPVPVAPASVAPRASIVPNQVPVFTKATLGTNIPRTVLSANPTKTQSSLIAVKRAMPTRQLTRTFSRSLLRRKKVDNFFSYQTFADCYNIKHQCKHECSQTSRPCIGIKTLNVSTVSTAPPTPPRNEKSLAKEQSNEATAMQPSGKRSMFKRIRRMLHIATKRTIFT